MYLLYKWGNDPTFDLSYTNPNIDSIKACKPGLFRLAFMGEKLNFKSRLIRLSFFLMTFGNFEIYYALSDESKVLHMSYVVGKCFKFPFMRKNDIEIRPCTTVPCARGKGIYPSVLKYIISCKKLDISDIYIFVDETNLPSIKGIEKCGFVKVEKLKKTAINQYKLLNEL